MSYCEIGNLIYIHLLALGGIAHCVLEVGERLTDLVCDMGAKKNYILRVLIFKSWIFGILPMNV